MDNSNESGQNGRVRRGHIVMGAHQPEKRDFSRYLRRTMTPAESLLWEQIRAGRLGVGLRFRRQQIIDGYIVDFFCHSAALIVEVDGPIHDQQKVEDELREGNLRKRNLRILRFTNEQIRFEMPIVVQKIREAT